MKKDIVAKEPVKKIISLKDDPAGYYYQKVNTNDINEVWANIKKPLEQNQALIEQVENDQAVEFLFRNSIILVQGQAGTHKSRLAGILVSTLLANDASRLFLNFRVKQSDNSKTRVIYIDTERNLRYQLPHAIRKIIEDAKLDLDSAQNIIAPFPLLNIPREYRLPVINLLLTKVDNNKDMHLCLVIDVVSDCIGDFNFLTEVYKLTDKLNMLINNHDVTIICVLHENPGSEKARGHLGTELTNKASTIVQISEHGDSDTFKISVLKNRNRKRSRHIFVKFDNTINTLEIINDEVAVAQLENKYITRILTILKECTSLMKISKKELFGRIKNQLSISDRTIQTQIDAIIKKKVPFEGHVPGVNYFLVRNRSKEVTFEFKVQDF